MSFASFVIPVVRIHRIRIFIEYQTRSIIQPLQSVQRSLDAFSLFTCLTFRQ